MRYKHDGQIRVIITAPGRQADIFEGCYGSIIGSEHDGSTLMYRVKLDKPINYPGVGIVTDDLWSADYLKLVSEETEEEEDASDSNQDGEESGS